MLYLPLILLLAAFVRLFQLGSLPISLFGDEVDVAYHAWSLFTTGRDYMGNFLPAYIQSLSEWRAPLLMYITAPFVGLFGTDPFFVRLPVALLGISSVFLIYLLAKKLFQSERAALLGAFLLAITPWHIHYSRASFEVVPLIFLELLGVYLFVSGRQFLSLIPFVLTFYTYSTANVFTPLMVLALIIIYKPKIWRVNSLPKLIIPFLIFLPIAYSILFGSAAGRFNIVSIFSDRKITENIINQRTDPWVSGGLVETLFHNKPLSVVAEWGKNYVRSFSPEFLFVSGDFNYRHSIGNMGELLWIVLPFLIYGIYLLLISLKDKSSKLLLVWLLIAPLASSLTQGGGTHATRLFLMIPPLVLISAKGLDRAFASLRGGTPTWQSHTIKISIILLFVLSFSSYWHRYTTHYKYESARYWHDGYRQIFSQLKPLLEGSDKVYINNTAEPSLIRFALFTGLHPSDFQASFNGDDQESYDNNDFYGFVFGERFYLGQVRPNKMISLLQPGDIYLAAQGREVPGDWDWSQNTPDGLEVVGFVRDVFGEPQFYLIKKLP